MKESPMPHLPNLSHLINILLAIAALSAGCRSASNKNRLKIDDGEFITGGVSNTVEGVFYTLTHTQGSNEGGACTGTAVSTNTAITASHCVYDGSNFLDTNNKMSGREYCVSNAIYKKVCSSNIYVNPGFPSRKEDAGGGYDTAFVVFPEGTFKNYFELTSTGPKVGDTVLLTGYSEYNLPDSSKGSKRFGYTEVVELDSQAQNDIITEGTRSFTGVAVSPGDSGGPMMNEQCQIVGVASRMTKGQTPKNSIHTNLTSPGTLQFLINTAKTSGGYFCGLSGRDPKYCPPGMVFRPEPQAWSTKVYPCNYVQTVVPQPSTQPQGTLPQPSVPPQNQTPNAPFYVKVDGDQSIKLTIQSTDAQSTTTPKVCFAETLEAAKSCNTTLIALPDGQMPGRFTATVPTLNNLKSGAVFHLFIQRGNQSQAMQIKHL
jgi:V8-like Glu-specific endopeptidase